MEYIFSTLIENRNQILLSVLQVISQEQRWYSISEISEELDVVERSVQRYVNILDNFFEEYEMNHGPGFTLLSKRTKGVYLTIDDNTNFSQLKKYVYQNDECIKIYNEVLFGNFESKSKYAQEHFLSVSYVSSTIKKIEEVLEEFYIQLSPTTFELDGEEAQIRLIMYSSAWFLYKGEKDIEIFKQFDADKLEGKVNYIVEKLNLSLNGIQRRELYLMLIVTILRYRQNKMVDLQEEWHDYVSSSPKNPITIVVKEVFESYYIFSQSEVVFFAISLLTRPYFYQQEKFRSRLITMHQHYQSDIYKSTQFFMSEFSNQITRIPDEHHEEIFIEVFRSHLYCKTYKNAPFEHNAHDYFTFIEKNYPKLFQRLSDFVDSLYEQTNNVLFLKRVFLIQKYLLVFAQIKPIGYFEKKMTIQIETDLPDMAVRRIEDYLKTYFKYSYNLKFLREDSFQQADLILSDMPSLEEQEADCLFVDYPLNKRDLFEIEKHITSHVTSHRDAFLI